MVSRLRSLRALSRRPTRSVRPRKTHKRSHRRTHKRTHKRSHKRSYKRGGGDADDWVKLDQVFKKLLGDCNNFTSKYTVSQKGLPGVQTELNTLLTNLTNLNKALTIEKGRGVHDQEFINNLTAAILHVTICLHGLEAYKL